MSGGRDDPVLGYRSHRVAEGLGVGLVRLRAGLRARFAVQRFVFEIGVGSRQGRGPVVGVVRMLGAATTHHRDQLATSWLVLFRQFGPVRVMGLRGSRGEDDRVAELAP